MISGCGSRTWVTRLCYSLLEGNTTSFDGVNYLHSATLQPHHLKGSLMPPRKKARHQMASPQKKLRLAIEWLAAVDQLALCFKGSQSESLRNRCTVSTSSMNIQSRISRYARCCFVRRRISPARSSSSHDSHGGS